MLKSIAIKNLVPNPFRRLDEYPILREKVDPLKESIRSTGFWGTIVGRPTENGKVEIAFGHHRRIALQEVYDGDHEVEIIVRGLSNDDMLKMMARENMEEWGTSAWVELETIRATVQAYGEGKLKQFPVLPKDTNKKFIRYAAKSISQGPYTVMSVAQYLGWTTTSENTGRTEPNFACETAFHALDMIDAGFLDEFDLRRLGRTQMSELVQGQWKIYQRELELSKYNKKEAEQAKQKAALAPTKPEAIRFETQAKVYDEQAQQHEKAATEKAKDFGKEAVDMYQSGKGYRDVRRRAEEIKPSAPPKTKIHSVDELADRIARKLENIANGDDDISGDVTFLKQAKMDLSDRAAESLCGSFDALIGRLERMKNAFKVSSRSH